MVTEYYGSFDQEDDGCGVKADGEDDFEHDLLALVRAKIKRACAKALPKWGKAARAEAECPGWTEWTVCAMPGWGCRCGGHGVPGGGRLHLSTPVDSPFPSGTRH